MHKFFFSNRAGTKASTIIKKKEKEKKKKDVYHYTDLKYVGVILYAQNDLIPPTPSHTRIQPCVLVEFSTATGLQNS